MADIVWTSTPVLAKITLPSGNTYFLKDLDVRNWIGDGSTSGAEKRITDMEVAIEDLQNATHWLGITTSNISDGSTLNPIVINGDNVTAINGDIVQDGNGVEYIFNGNLATPAWQQFGASIGTVKAFAFVDTGTVTITPAGTNSSSAVTFSGGTDAAVLGADTTFTNASSAVTFSGGTDDTVLGADTTFTNSTSPVTFSGGADGKLVQTSVPNVTSVGSAASWSATVSNEVLTFAWTPGVVPTLGTAIDVATGAIASDGTGDTVVTAVGTGTAGAQTITVGSNDTVTAITDIGTGTAAAQTITVGTNDKVTAVTGIGTGTAAAQTFTGTEATHTVYPTSST